MKEEKRSGSVQYEKQGEQRRPSEGVDLKSQIRERKGNMLGERGGEMEGQRGGGRGR